jgi:SulP family sulfate permease
MASDVHASGKRTAQPAAKLPRWQARLYKLVPALDSLRTYTPTTFRRDLIAGVTVAAVAVPQAMAYASIFGMPVQYGLYTAIVMTAVGALLDSSKQLINGPTNAISIAMLSALAIVPSDQRIPAAMMMAALIGGIQTGITLLRLGDLSRYISHAVIVGFTAGASVLLVLDQLKNVLGLPAKGEYHDHFVKRFLLTMSSGEPIHTPTLAVACGTIATALALRWLNRRFRLGLPEL